jgi:anti-sigma B factor antagonist
MLEDYQRVAVSFLGGTAGDIAMVEVLDRQVFEPQVVRQLFGELESILRASRSKNLLIDLSQLQYVSSNALNRLIDLQALISGAGGRLKLCGLRPEIAEIFAITHLDRHFEIAPDQSAALSAF